MAQAAQRLLLLPGIEAKTRQQVNIFGQHLVGSGTYLQLTNGPRLMLRLDLKLQVANRPRACSKSVMATRSGSAAARATKRHLSRVNLRRLRDVASRVGPSDVPPPPTLWMALGGLPRLLAALDTHFDFDPPKPMTIGQGKLPVWSLEGHWKPAILANLLPDQKAEIQRASGWTCRNCHLTLPHGVTVDTWVAIR